MSIFDSASEQFHEYAWPNHCDACPICAGIAKPWDNTPHLCAKGRKLWEQYDTLTEEV
jgi:hypothetical protein